MPPCSPFVDLSIGRVTLHTAATPPTGVDLYEGKVIWETDTNKLKLYDGAAWREIIDIDGWATWTPALSGTGYAIVNGTIGGLYRLHPDSSYEYIIVVVWGASTTSGAGPMTLSTPATFLNTNLAGSGIGHTDIIASSTGFGEFYDASATTYFPLHLNYGSTTTNTVQCLSYDGSSAGVAYVKYANVTSTVPVAPAQFDVYRFYGRGFTL